MAESLAESVICWDFDHTLFGYQGDSPPITQRGAQPAQSSPSDAEFRGFGSRPGIEATLQRLAQQQIVSDITTGASLALVTRALAATGATELLRHIMRVFPGEEITVGASKYYQSVAQFHGLSPEVASARMLVVGDLHDDAPADLADVVLIRQPYGHLRDPRVVEAVIARLRVSGAGDFARGFRAMYAEAQRAGRRIQYGGWVLAEEGTALVCLEESPPGAQRAARLGDAPIPVISLLESTLLASF